MSRAPTERRARRSSPLSVKDESAFLSLRVRLLGSGLAVGILAVPGLIEFVDFVAPTQRFEPSLLALKVIFLKVLSERHPLIPRLAVVIEKPAYEHSRSGR
jgi:hypothetical protein